MKELQLIDRVVVEIKGEGNEELKLSDIAYELRYIADQIEDGISSGDEEESGKEHMWEHECKRYGGFRMGNRSLICDAYYGAKQTFEVCCVEREDLESRGFDTSKLTNDDMERIANKAGDLILEGCDYWTGVVEAARYWDVPRKDDDVQEVIPGTQGMLNELSIRE